MEYNPRDIEQKWRDYWVKEKIYEVSNQSDKPKYYVLDMFPYPSGAGLHVGHPLGYIATDIFSRYKRLKGYNVLHPMGYDSFGLPAEQYAISTGQHPAITTENNINTFRSQLEKLGFSYDWSREVRTSDPKFYKWTQWIFMQLFRHYYDSDANKALPISALETRFATEGNGRVNAVCDEDTPPFTADEWRAMSPKEQQLMLLKYRLTFPEESYVNWCPGLGTVLSNDEVKDGVSERGGYPVERKLMKQWSMRITAYADRLLEGLADIDWPESIKDQQTNWIGRSQGASVRFAVDGHADKTIEVFTTRVDTIYGATFMVLAPEHEYVADLTTSEQREEIEAYVKWAASRSDVERMAEVKKVTGAFTGSYAVNPFNNEKIPIWIADYVLAGYGTGAVMAVPSGDQRDWNFATHFGLPIVQILDSQQNLDEEADPTKEGKYVNSGMINGMTYEEATQTLINWLEERGLGKGKIQYRLHNAVFSRQRYWGEPVPVYWDDEVPHLIDESELPLLLPKVDKYLPTETGEPPLGRAENWKYKGKYPYELSTMPGWAGSSWYFYRYMDPGNDEAFCSQEAVNYWQQVDLYLGGSEHAVGHLLYSRFWNKFLYDLGLVPHEEYARKLINQGMIQGRSLMMRIFKENGGTRQIHVPIFYADEQDRLSVGQFEKLKKEDSRFAGIELDFNNTQAANTVAVSTENGEQFIQLYPEVEKMSKSKYNVVNPDVVVSKYGADCFRMYEMFLGPIEQAKPWDTKGIDGVSRFLRKFWGLFFDDKGNFSVSDDAPNKQELKALHAAIKKVNEDIERFSFNTCVSAFMVATNELKDLKCNKRAILQELVVLLAPFAPHVAEELWHRLGNTGSVHADGKFPEHNEEYLKEDEITYPVSINGKVRAKTTFPADASKADLEKEALEIEGIQKWIEGKEVRRVIVVPGRMINVVVDK
jgi:leucyl-tRNA synthetase